MERSSFEKADLPVTFDPTGHFLFLKFALFFIKCGNEDDDFPAFFFFIPPPLMELV